MDARIGFTSKNDTPDQANTVRVPIVNGYRQGWEIATDRDSPREMITVTSEITGKDYTYALARMSLPDVRYGHPLVYVQVDSTEVYGRIECLSA